MTLTDEQIDQLSGRELDAAVCLVLGWTQHEFCRGRKMWFRQGGHKEPRGPHEYHDDLGAAMKLLTGLITEQCLSVYIRITGFSSNARVFVYESLGSIHADNVITEGQAVDHATVICRAFLKLRNRS